jgi:hypothetical protein
MFHKSSFTFYYDYFSLFLAHLALYYTNQKQKSFMFTKKKAEAPCSGATGIRQAGMKVALFNLLDGLAYDPEPLGARAGLKKAEVQELD